MSNRINTAIPIFERPDIAAGLHPMLIEIGARAFTMGRCTIIVGNEPDGWHISISRKDRDPSWDEIATARYRLLPHVEEMVMFLPPLRDYVNIDEHCFHLSELRRAVVEEAPRIILARA